MEIYQTIIVSVMFSLPLIVAYVPSYLESKTDVILLVESATIFIEEPIISKNVQKFLKFTLKIITPETDYKNQRFQGKYNIIHFNFLF